MNIVAKTPLSPSEAASTEVAALPSPPLCVRIIVPGEVELDIPPELDGSNGRFRAPTEDCFITARDDREAALAWVAVRGNKSARTRETYLREINRLFVWAYSVRGLPISSLTEQDLEEYRAWLEHPPAHLISWWVDKNGKSTTRKFPLADPRWRPFSSQDLSEVAREHAMTVVKAMYSYLHRKGWMRHNPAQDINPKLPGEKKSAATKRHFPLDWWGDVLVAIDELPQETIEHRKAYARARFFFRLMRGTGIRLSELQAATWDAILEEPDDDHVRRFLVVTGKGRKTRKVPLPADVIEEAMSYRIANGRSENWRGPADRIEPLILPLRNHGDGIVRQAIHSWLKTTTNAMVTILQGRDKPYVASLLEKLSSHWLRHSAASDWLSGGATLGHVKDALGHTNIQTTSNYIHTTDNEMHDGIEQARKRLNYPV